MNNLEAVMFAKQKKIKLISGQSMFEVVLALFIITLITVAIVLLSTKSISNSLFSRSKTQASRYSQEAIEWLRNQRETNQDTFSTYSGTPTYCLNSNPPSFANSGACSSAELIPNTIYKRQLSFTTTTVSGKTIIMATVVTSWNDSKGYHEVRAVTEFNDIRQE